MRFRPLIRGLSISSADSVHLVKFIEVSVPSSGDYQFLQNMDHLDQRPINGFRPLIRGLSISSLLRRLLLSSVLRFPSPHPGIINFFIHYRMDGLQISSFRPLIRGLSISSDGNVIYLFDDLSFPSPHPGIINFFFHSGALAPERVRFPSPHPGIINFFANCNER